MTLKFNTVLKIVEIHVRAKFHQAKCSGSCVIVLTEKRKLSDDAENNTALASAGTKTYFLGKGTCPVFIGECRPHSTAYRMTTM